MSLFLRVFQHLLPRAEAWKLVVDKALTRFFEGLAGTMATARAFVDDVWEDIWPETTRDLAAWEQQHGLTAGPERILALTAAWQAQGGQSPRYLQDTLQAAGFDVYIHEWWSSGPPYVARDPNDYLTQPTWGTATCGNPATTCGSGATANRELTSALDYLVNKDLTNRAPPPIPSDPTKWPFFLYIGAETFPGQAFIPEARRVEFERLVLKIRPLHQWVGLLVEYVGEDALTTEGGSYLLTEGGEALAIES